MAKTMTLEKFRSNLTAAMTHAQRLPVKGALATVEQFGTELDDLISSAIREGHTRIQLTSMLAIKVKLVKGRKHFVPGTGEYRNSLDHYALSIVQSAQVQRAASQAHGNQNVNALDVG